MTAEGDRARRVLVGIPTARRIEVKVSGAMLRRLRAHMARLERRDPGIAYEPGESDEDSLRVALEALIDGGLALSEAEDGLVADFLTGDIRPYMPPLGTRARRAWRLLRHGH